MKDDDRRPSGPEGEGRDRSDDDDWRIRVGTSGWRYASWRGDYYPRGLVQRRELEFIASRLGTVEINGSFYSLQRPESYQRWAEATPEGFVFGVKGGRFVTHMLRLREPRQALANFFASGVLLLGPKLGPILWQLPERLVFDAGEFERFAAELPRTHAEAARLAGEHDERVRNVGIPDAPPALPLRHALEPRHPSFGEPAALELLRRHGIALVTADSPGFPLFEEVTSDFVYVRLHGASRLYHGEYEGPLLDGWARRIRRLATGAGHGQRDDGSRHGHDTASGHRSGGKGSDAHQDDSGRMLDSYVYFDNDADGRAPWDAEALSRMLREATREERSAPAGRHASGS